MPNIAVQPLTQAWSTVRSFVPLAPIHTERQYDQAVQTLQALLDIIGDNEHHPLYELLDTLGVLIEAYEENEYPAPEVTGHDMLTYLLAEHHLTSADLPEIGGVEAVEAVLAGQRELTVPEIRAISARFGLSPATFL